MLISATGLLPPLANCCPVGRQFQQAAAAQTEEAPTPCSRDRLTEPQGLSGVRPERELPCRSPLCCFSRSRPEDRPVAESWRQDTQLTDEPELFANSEPIREFRA